MTVMRIIDAATSLRFSAVCSSTSSYEVSSIHVSSRRLLRSTLSDVPWNRSRRSDSHSSTRGRITAKNWLRASIEDVGSSSDPSNQNGRLQYHPSEDISESLSDNEDAKLTAQETARTIVEVNRKATLMLSDLINDDIHENIVWPDMPYMTDEHGNVYFKVKKDEDILQTITSENNFVQAVIGFDTSEILNEMELLDSSQFDLGIEEIDDEDSDLQDDDEEEEDESEYDDYDEDLVAVLDDEDEKDDSDIGDWAKLDTMRSSHPMYFARQLALVASDDPMDWMEQPPVGLVIQGLIRPTFIEEHSNIQRHLSINQSNHADINCDERKDKSESEEDLGGVGRLDHLSGPSIDGSNLTEESEKDGVGGTSFYKLEMIKIQLISPHGHQSMVDVEDYRKSQPDAIAHSAEKIISRLKAGGEKITEALKSVCWRCKGIQVEEAVIIGIDSRGFDLRVCSGTQVQTLRFPFNSRATSEYGAERQLNDILHPWIHHSMSKKKQAHQKEQ